jgi:hypothetical protein
VIKVSRASRLEAVTCGNGRKLLDRGLFDPKEVVALAWDASGSGAYATSRGGVWTIDLGQ